MPERLAAARSIARAKVDSAKPKIDSESNSCFSTRPLSR
jgi:hypothetical protein